MNIAKKILFFFLLISSISTSIFSQNTNTGELKINVNLPESFYLVNGIDFINAQKLDSGKVIKLTAGLYTFTIVSKYVDDHQLKVQIVPGEVTMYSHTFKVFRIDYKSTFSQLENQENLVITSDLDSEIFINGIAYGKSYVSLLVNPGIYNIESVHPVDGRLEQKIKVDWEKTYYLSRFNKPQIKNASSINLIPGGGYLINGQKDKAILTYLSMSLLIGSYFSLDRKIRSQNPIFNIDKLENYQTASLIGLGAVYILSTLDGKRKPKNGYPGNASTVELTGLNLSHNLIPTAGLRINF